MDKLYYVELFRCSSTNHCYWFKVFNNEHSAKALYRKVLEIEAFDKVPNYKELSNNELCDAILNYIRGNGMEFDYEFYLDCDVLEVHD